MYLPDTCTNEQIHTKYQKLLIKRRNKTTKLRILKKKNNFKHIYKLYKKLTNA